MSIIGCKKHSIELDVQNEPDFEHALLNWSDAHSARWLTYAVHKAVSSHKNVPDGQLVQLVGSYLEPVLNAKRHYHSQISSLEEYSTKVDLESYLKNEYRVNYEYFDKRVNDFEKLDKLYKVYLQLLLSSTILFPFLVSS